MRIKFHGCLVVTLNRDMEVWQPGYVIVDGSRIEAAGPGPGPEGAFDEVVELADAVVMPGLINAHAHSPSNLLKGSWSRLPLEIWRQYLRAGWREFSEEAIYVSSQLGILEMLKTGCTAVLDHFYTGSPHEHMGALSAVRAMDDAGMRGALALTLSDRRYQDTVPASFAGLGEAGKGEVEEISRFESSETLDGCRKFMETVQRGSRLVTPMIGPSAPHRCTDELLTGSMELAEDFGTAVHIHVAETKGQYLQGAELYGTSIVSHLDAVGILNDRLSMAHCVWLSRDDMRKVAARGATAVHNPASNGKLGSGRMRYDEMLELGVRVGLATDGSGSNDTQNMFEAVRLAGLLHNRNDRDYLQWPSPEQILRSATSDSAYALGLGGKVGTIASGQAADLVFLTVNSYHLTPLNDVHNQLVFCENGASVDSVMVDGRWVVKDRQVLTIDEGDLYARARQLRQDMNERLEEQFRRTAKLEPALREMYLRVSEADWPGKREMDDDAVRRGRA